MDEKQNSTTPNSTGPQPTVINPSTESTEASSTPIASPSVSVPSESPAVPAPPKTPSEPAAPVTPDVVSPAQSQSSETKPSVVVSTVPETEKVPLSSPDATQPPQVPQNAPLAATPAAKQGRSKLKLLLIALVGILLLAGASAGAYFGVIIPNKPEHKLLQGFLHLAEQTKLTTKGKIDISLKDDSSPVKSIAIDYTAQSDTEAKHFDVSSKVGVMGVTVPFDMRYVEEDVYLKVAGIDGLVKAFSSGGATAPQAGSQFESVAKQIDDKWFVINRSLLQESEETSCSLATDWKLTDEDMDKIKNAYRKNPLFTVKGQSDADVDGVKTTKFEVDPASEETAKNFGKDVESLSIVENLKKCTKDSNSADVQEKTDELAEEQDKAQIFVYLTRDKKIKKLEIIVDNEGTKANITAIFDHGVADIQKPEDARPIQDLMAILMTGSGMPDMTNTSSGAGLGTGLFDAISL